MEYLFGFVIALCTAITGVGAGTITVPLLILFLHVPADMAVGMGLVYSAIVKLIVVPAQVLRKQIDYRVLGCMLIGGLPGVIGGSILFTQAMKHLGRSPIGLLLGIILVMTSTWCTFRHVFSAKLARPYRWYPKLLLITSSLIGTEMGFSSLGAGALGTAALMGMTDLSAVRVVGTDLAFSLALSTIGSVFHAAFVLISSRTLIRLSIGGVLGAILGTGIAPKIPNHKLRVALSLWLTLMGFELVYQALTT
jgi:hypothetical protein